MGFLKRLFSGSIRTRKHKRQRVDREQEHLARARKRQEDEAEATLTRLLRSSSTKWEVLSQTDLLASANPESLSRASTPPTSVSDAATLRAPSPAYSTASAPLLSYNVTVHERTVLTPALPATPRRRSPKKRTPHRRRSSLPLPSQLDDSLNKRGSVMGTPRSTVYIDNGMTPNEKGVFTNLRRDPSIRTIVGIYDAHGCVSEELLCANTPARPTAPSRIPTLKAPLREVKPVASKSSVRDSTPDSEPVESPPPSEFSPEPESDAYDGLATEAETHEEGDVTVEAETQEDLPIELLGKVQVHRTGSTLRQLLGVPDEPVASEAADTSEGDLSWAERMLANEHVGDANAFSAFLRETSKGENTPARKSSVESNDTASAELVAPESPELVRASHLPAPTPAPSKTLPKEDSPPIAPASEVFAFLLAPRRSKASAPPLTTPTASSSTFSHPSERTANGAGAYPSRMRNYYLPPVPPVQSFLRQGPTGRPFAAAAAAPTQTGRGRSNSAGPADVLSGNGAWTNEHRRAATDTAVSSSAVPMPASASAAVPPPPEPQSVRIPLPQPVRPLRRSGSLGAAPLLVPPPVPPKDHPVRPSPRSANPLAELKLQPTRSLAPTGLKNDLRKRGNVLTAFADASSTPAAQQYQRRKGSDKENVSAVRELVEETPRTPARPKSAMAFYAKWEKEAERR